MVILEVHMTTLFGNLIDFIELIHIELSNKRRQVFVPKKIRQDFVLKLLGILYQDLCAIVGPCYKFFVLVFLNG